MAVDLVGTGLPTFTFSLTSATGGSTHKDLRTCYTNYSLQLTGQTTTSIDIALQGTLSTAGTWKDLVTTTATGSAVLNSATAVAVRFVRINVTTLSSGTATAHVGVAP